MVSSWLNIVLYKSLDAGGEEEILSKAVRVDVVNSIPPFVTATKRIQLRWELTLHF